MIFARELSPVAAFFKKMGFFPVEKKKIENRRVCCMQNTPQPPRRPGHPSHPYGAAPRAGQGDLSH